MNRITLLLLSAIVVAVVVVTLFANRTAHRSDPAPAAFPATDASTPVAIKAAPGRPTTASDIYAASDAQSGPDGVAAHPLDRAVSSAYLEDICSFPIQHREGSFADAIANADSRRGSAANSAALLDGFAKSHCKSIVASPTRKSSALEDAVIALARRGDAEAASLLQAKSVLLDENATEEEHSQALRSLRALLATTDSSAMFMEAGQQLASYDENWHPADLGSKRLDDQARLNAAVVGVAIANCHVFRNCGPDSTFTLRSCMPDKCSPAGFEGYLRQLLNDQELETARMYARSILAQRVTTNG